MLPWDNLSDRLAQFKTAGAYMVRLILENESIRVAPVGEGAPRWVLDDGYADADLSADREAKDE
jgi:hypothetical protein